jgi:ribosomal protein L10
MIAGTLEVMTRADLEARITRARQCLEAADVAEAYRIAAVAKLRALAIAKGLASRRGKKATAKADWIEATLARDVAEVRAPASKLLEILQAELQGLGEEEIC